MQYAEAVTHRLMVRDSARTDAFHRAITSAVKPGDVVLDVGAGSGILSLFAARAGARRVYAVECTPIARLAARLAQVNGLSDTVQIIEAPIESVTLPERVDVIVSEWLGTIGVDENLLGLVLTARDRWLRSPDRVLPRRITAWMAPARVAMRPDVSFFKDDPYGLDLSPLAESSVRELLSYRRRISPADMVAAPAAMWTTDVATAPMQEATLPTRTAMQFVVERKAAVNSLVAWFTAELAAGVSHQRARCARHALGSAAPAAVPRAGRGRRRNYLGTGRLHSSRPRPEPSRLVGADRRRGLGTSRHASRRAERRPGRARLNLAVRAFRGRLNQRGELNGCSTSAIARTIGGGSRSPD